MAVSIVLWSNSSIQSTDKGTDYPSYELFTETLREGTFKPVPHATTASAPPTGWEGRQLRLVVDKNRRVQEIINI